MMIKKFAKMLDYNPIVSVQKVNHVSPIEINDNVDPEHSDTTTVYFDAALSRKIVSEKAKEAKYVWIQEKDEVVYFVYDAETFNQEINFDKFEELINSKKEIKETGLHIYSGDCACTYRVEQLTITVYPTNETSISDNGFKLF